MIPSTIAQSICDEMNKEFPEYIFEMQDTDIEEGWIHIKRCGNIIAIVECDEEGIGISGYDPGVVDFSGHDHLCSDVQEAIDTIRYVLQVEKK